MPQLEDQFRHQKAVYWEASGVDNDGEHTLLAPNEIMVRFDEKKEETRDANGTPVSIDGSMVVGQAIPVGSILWLGNLLDLPSTLSDLMEVVTHHEIQDIKGRNVRKEVTVKKHSNTLPTLV